MTSLLCAMRVLHFTLRRPFCVSVTAKNFIECSWSGFRTFCNISFVSDEMKTVDEKIQEKISEWKNGVDMEKLNDKEKVIHHLHLESLDKCQNVYIDPETGYTVLNMEFHLQKGKCCGNGCRHCPYQHVNVPKEKKQFSGVFNSSFYAK